MDTKQDFFSASPTGTVFIAIKYYIRSFKGDQALPTFINPIKVTNPDTAPALGKDPALNFSNQ